MKQNKNYRFKAIKNAPKSKKTSEDDRFDFTPIIQPISDHPSISHSSSFSAENEPENLPAAQFQENPSKYLVILNANWDSFTANDALVLAQSFAPLHSTPVKATIFVSNFGKKQLELESLNGPNLDIRASLLKICASDSDLKRKLRKIGVENYKKILDLEPELEQKVAEQAVFQYEQDKLKYYFCVIEFSSSQGASAVFGAINNSEIGSSGCIIECQILDEEDAPEIFKMNVKDSSEVVPVGYRPIETQEAGFAHCKPVLTWEIDQKREKVLKKKVSGKELDEMDERGAFDEFLDCDGEEEFEFEGMNWGEEEESEDEKCDESEIQARMAQLLKNNKQCEEITPFQKFLAEKGKVNQNNGEKDVNLQFRRQTAEVLVQEAKVDTRKEKMFRRLKRAVDEAQNVKERDFAVKKYQKFIIDNPEVQMKEKEEIVDCDDDRFDFGAKNDEK